jgi:hypothetical protein
MKGQELRILFKYDKAYLTPDVPLTLKMIGLPEIVKSFKENAFWTFRVLNYNESQKKLFCDITSYQTGETGFANNQKLLFDTLREIQIVTFRSIDTGGLLRIIDKIERVPQYGIDSMVIIPEQPKEKRQPETITIEDTFDVNFFNVNFLYGKVWFRKNFNQYEEEIIIEIPNKHIRKEFEFIKIYFANILKIKQIEVTVYIEIFDNKVKYIKAVSPEIDRIDNQIINKVKFEFIASIIKKKDNPENHKSVFTMDEYFHSFGGSTKASIFYANDSELFNDMLTISNTKHSKNLIYLSIRHDHEIMRLRFVHNPFSFLFLIQGEKNYHIVWETLDTKEATYVWHIEKNLSVLQKTLVKIERIINAIKVQGKLAYISSNEEQFRRIYHDYSDINGYQKWEKELESCMI